MKRLAKILLVLAVLAGIGLWLTPWKQMAERAIVRSLTIPGLPQPVVEVESLGLRGLRLARLDLPGLVELAGVDVAFSPLEAIQGEIEEIHLASITLALSQDDQGNWQLPQLEQPTGEQHAFAPPWKRLVIDAGTLRLRGNSITGDIPFSGSWEVSAQPVIALATQPFTLQVGKLAVAVEKAQLELQQKEESWEGPWSAQGITSSGALEQFGAAGAEGNAKLGKQNRIDITLKAPADKLLLALQAQWNEGGTTQLRLSQARVITPQGGQWEVRPISLPLSEKAAWNLNIQVSRQPVAELLALLGQEKVESTGTLQGTIPLRVEPHQGRITVGQAQLNAVEAGRLSMQGNLFPSGEQVGNVSELMSDFRYNVLSMEMSGALDEGEGRTPMTVHLVLEGNNPAVYDGRAVRLNITLRGDLASLLRQSLMPINDPKGWINEGK